MDGLFGKLFGSKKKNTHTPGTFLSDDNDYQSTLSPEQRQRFGLDDKLEEFEQVQLEGVLTSRDLRNAFKNLKALTFPKIPALNQKRFNVFEINEKGLIASEDLKKGVAVYIGSGTDIEYPLLLGANNIIMVDPLFTDSEGIESLIEEIESIIGKGNVQQDSNRLSFQFSFKGDLKEEVIVIVEGKYANIGMVDQTKDVFIPENNISLLLGFASGGTLDEDENLINAVINGGYILGDLKQKELLLNDGFSAVLIERSNNELFKKDSKINY